MLYPVETTTRGEKILHIDAIPPNAHSEKTSWYLDDESKAPSGTVSRTHAIETRPTEALEIPSIDIAVPTVPKKRKEGYVYCCVLYALCMCYVGVPTQQIQTSRRRK